MEHPYFSSLLDKIVADPAREREWIDLLSQLEYVGCRKILKSVPFEGVSLDVIQHAAEEASHAFLLKALVDGDRVACSWPQNPMGTMGWKYFQGLDHAVSAIEPPGGNYPAVSWIVEQRVLHVYPEYEAKTTHPGVKRVISRILAQERRHGGQFGPYTDEVAEGMRVIEARHWDEFCGALGDYLATTAIYNAPTSST